MECSNISDRENRDKKLKKSKRYIKTASGLLLQLPDDHVSFVLATTNHSTLVLVSCEDDNEEYECVAKIFKNHKQGESEYCIGSTLHHDNVLTPLAFYRSSQRFIIYYPYCEGGSLEDLVNKSLKLNERICRIVFKQMVKGLQYLHRCGILHNDVKLENFLIGSNKVKICDYGLARRLETDAFDEDFVGTPYFMAPEVLMRVAHTFSADVWSLGICLYYMYYRRLPYVVKTEHELKHAMFHKDINFPVRPEMKLEFDDRPVSDEFKDLLKKILVMKPCERLTLDEILDHPWLDPATTIQSARTDHLNASGYHYLGRPRSAPPKL
jgi:serine/threonine protein kinase